MTRTFPPLGWQASGALAATEERDWIHIIEAAQRMGWLAPEDRARVLRAPALVVVEVIREQQVQVRCYPDDDRWLYEFLRELSTGIWRAE